MTSTITLPEPRLLELPERKARTVRLAIAGCGVVGGELLHLLQERAENIERSHGLRFEVVRVLVRDVLRPRRVHLDDDLLTSDLDEFLAADADLVVEAIGGLEPAGLIARETLSRGRGLVTANKALIAAHGHELAALASETSAALSFEAAVAGGVPVIRVLRESLPETGVRSIRGILNGTTNYILSRMSGGASFTTALAEAQASGFAEADPTRDLDGTDAAEKIRILAWQTFGTQPRRLQVHRTGLLPEPDRIVEDAAALGGVAKLIAECVLLPDGVAASVEPVIVSSDSPFASVPAEENLLVVDTTWTGTVTLSGPGAGGGPTASSVLSDLLRPAAAHPRTHAAAPAGIQDPALHRWTLSVPRGARARTALLRAAELAQVDVVLLNDTSAGTRLLTAPLPRRSADTLADAVAAAGLQPLLLRCETAPLVPGGIPA